MRNHLDRKDHKLTNFTRVCFLAMLLFFVSTLSHATEKAAKKVLMVLASPTVSSTTGWPVGFWAAELTHPYDKLTAAGFTVELASTKGGPVQVDAYSDPRHESGYSAHDFVSLGFLTSPVTAPLLESTKALDHVNAADYAAILIVGGQAPMESFRENKVLQGLIRSFYESGRPTAALCHGVAALVDVKTSAGKYLIDGKKVTGFSLAEDQYAEKAVGGKMFSWYVEPAMKERGAQYSEGGMWASYAVVDGNLITGQQQNSGRQVATLITRQLLGK